jgi:hypothetical protein
MEHSGASRLEGLSDVARVPATIDGLSASLCWAVPQGVKRKNLIYDQECINFPQYRDPLSGSECVTLPSLYECRRRINDLAGGVDHGG